MAYEQRYTQETDYYEVDDWFVSKLKEFPRNVGIEIATQVEMSYDTFPVKSGWSQRIGGVITNYEPPIYFEIEYVNQPDEAPLLMDIELIEVDEYLDYVIENNILKSKYNAQTDRRTQDKKITD
jgi:hypothetical protein